MDMDINKYNHRKNVACALVLFAALTANAYTISYAEQFTGIMEYAEAIQGVMIGAVCSEVWALITVIASLFFHMEKKEHHKKLDMLAQWTVMSAITIFVLNVVAAALGHVSMMALKEKIEGQGA
eukprot:TRINITY_DN6320_c0_g2_i1.p1 TRINITY_DN6320_c0_g2~~TRINITY_DN6320_c0_g2_i1.p1  ORF type:complete len:124 (-),score=18.59 TRINITY_DN6320_c0_g2_i1:252-623(-)